MDVTLSNTSERECAKCGSLLGDEDEGLCRGCGTPFGFSTTLMPQVTPEMLQAQTPDILRKQTGQWVESGMHVTAEIDREPEGEIIAGATTEGLNHRRLLIAVGGLIAFFAVILILLLVR